MHRNSLLLALLFSCCSHIALSAQCQLEYKGTDNQGREVTAIESELMWTYTSDQLDEFVKEREFIQSEAQMVIIDKKYYLRLKINLASERATDFYGKILIGQPIQLTFLDREPTFLEIVYTAAPQVDTKENETTYELTAKLSSSNLKAIRKCSLDNMGLVWTSGFESYPIYAVDILKEQYSCLKKLQ